MAWLIGMNEDRITREVTALLTDRQQYEKMARTVNPYGDGRASERIVSAICKWFSAE